MKSRLIKISVALLHDLAATLVAYFPSLYLRLGEYITWLPLPLLLSQVLLLLPICAASYIFSGLYRGIWAYASVRDLFVIIKATAIGLALYLAASFFISRLEGIPRTTLIMTWVILVVLMGGARLAYRLMRDGRFSLKWQKAGAGRASVLLYGAGDEADLFIRSLLTNPHAPYQVVGVIAENDKRVGRYIQNTPVLGQMEDLPRILADLKRSDTRPSRLIITKPPAQLSEVVTQNLIEQTALQGLTLARVPQATELNQYGVENKTISDRPLAIEDLLGRAEVKLDRGATRELIMGKRVLVTGAGGTIGSELCRQIYGFEPAQLTLVDHNEFALYKITTELTDRQQITPLYSRLGDVRDFNRVQQLFAESQPEVVFHAAAIKHVPLAEDNPHEAVLTNVLGSRNVFQQAEDFSSQVCVLISTDKAVAPSSVMGATKRVAELLCQQADKTGQKCRFVAVRFGNVLGSTGSVVPRFQDQIHRGGPVTVTHPDMTRFFMSIFEAVQLVLQASAHGARQQNRGRILVLDMGKPMRIVELAQHMIRLAGKKPDQDIQITYTGLRAGEKMHEELHAPDEKLLASTMSGLHEIALNEKPFAEKHVEQLIETAKQGITADQLRQSLFNICAAEGGLKKSA